MVGVKRKIKASGVNKEKHTDIGNIYPPDEGYSSLRA
jgi:hypothetical protein